MGSVGEFLLRLKNGGGKVKGVQLYREGDSFFAKGTKVHSVTSRSFYIFRGDNPAPWKIDPGSSYGNTKVLGVLEEDRRIVGSTTHILLD